MRDQKKKVQLFGIDVPSGKIIIALRRPINKVLVYDIAKQHANCHKCAEYASLYLGDYGPNGYLLFHHGSQGITEVEHMIEVQNPEGVIESDFVPEYILVDANTYGPSQVGIGRLGIPFYHWTVIPDFITEESNATQFRNLKSYIPLLRERLSKFTMKDAKKAVLTIIKVTDNHCIRSGHWKSVLKWIKDIQDRASMVSFDTMNEEEKMRLIVFALMTGRVSDVSDCHLCVEESSDARDCNHCVHFDYQQSKNIIDFTKIISKFTDRDYGNEELCRVLSEEMDRRSDPGTYQITQINRLLQEEKVEEHHTISLYWKGNYTDDLDLHVILPNGIMIYFKEKNNYYISSDGKTKVIARLRLDDGVQENNNDKYEVISVKICDPENDEHMLSAVKSGNIAIYVNCYTRRSVGEIPFKIIISSFGVNTIHDMEWKKEQNRVMKVHRFLHVCNHEFSNKPIEAPTMSKSESKRIIALDSEWKDLFGNPKSVIMTAENLQLILDGMNNSQKEGQKDNNFVVCQKKSNEICPTNKLVQMAKKIINHPSENRIPKTMEELQQCLENGKRVEICMHNYSPGYLVYKQTKTDVQKNSLPNLVYFSKIGRLPGKPTNDNPEHKEDNNASLDKSWINNSEGRDIHDETTPICAIAYIKGHWFLALKYGKLSESSDFPLAGGYYPTDLKTSLHSHKTRWVNLNTEQKPIIKEEGTPMIGTFLLSPLATFYVQQSDGILLRCSISVPS